MAQKLADDGIPFGWIDKVLLWLLPAFLAYVGAKVSNGGIWGYVTAAVGAVAGIAVVRGIQAAVNQPS